MASTHTTLDAAATERKARLAKLKSLKRKQPPTEDSEDQPEPSENVPPLTPNSTLTPENPPDPTTLYLSGRNYDPSTQGPKLGFSSAPSDSTETLEARAAAITSSTLPSKSQKEEAETEKPIDLFALRPRKPNWDLKRDLERKMETLGAKTENAIVRLVRERVEGLRKKAEGEGRNGEGGDVGIGGVELVEGVKVRERDEEEEERREREEDDMV